MLLYCFLHGIPPSRPRSVDGPTRETGDDEDDRRGHAVARSHPRELPQPLLGQRAATVGVRAAQRHHGEARDRSRGARGEGMEGVKPVSS